MKLSDYAEQLGISYQTAWRHFKAGKIPYPTRKLPSGTLVVDYNPDLPLQMKGKAAIYARVSSAENKDNLERQAERLQAYAIARGYQVQRVVKETGSGLNDDRRKLAKLLTREDAKLLTREDYEILIVERRDTYIRRCGESTPLIFVNILDLNLAIILQHAIICRNRRS